MGKLDRDGIRRFYDRFGARQDSQDFYEDAALTALIRAGDFATASSVLEIGCGTGRFAARLLEAHLPATARYVAIDLSTTMITLARERLSPWHDRVRIAQTDGSFDFRALGGPFDRVVATYLFDLLDGAQIAAALAASHGALRRGGLLCTAGLTEGTGPLSRTTSGLWHLLHRLSPYLVGGCRPLRLADHLAVGEWRLRHREVVVSFAVPSEVIVAEAL